MQIHTKEHYEILELFERDFAHMRLDREDKALWPQGNIYQNGETNNLFLAFRRGFSAALSVAA